MFIIVALDNHNGMLFNHRRQSRDKSLRERMLRLTAGHTLWMNRYSAGQFSECCPGIRIAEDFLDRAEENDYCFVETDSIARYIGGIQKIIAYRWNRDYPRDISFDIDLSCWRCVSSMDFVGSSHEKITEEVYSRWET